MMKTYLIPAALLCALVAPFANAQMPCFEADGQVPISGSWTLHLPQPWYFATSIAGLLASEMAV